MYKLYCVLLFVFACTSGFSQILTGGAKHEAVDSNTIKVTNLLTDPDADKAPRVVLSGGVGVWAPNIKFEERINKSFSAGFNLGGRFIFFTGGQLEPFGRYYFKKHAPKGLFIQVKGIVGLYHTRIRDGAWAQSITGGGPPPRGGHGRRGGYQLPSTLLENYGAGATIGYQFILGKNKHCALEVFGGFQYVYSTLDISYHLLIQKLAMQNPVDIGIKIGGGFW